MIIQQLRGERRGATAVETAFILVPLTMFLFGVFEYGWLLMNWNLVNNSAREGCRYALANNTDTTLATDVQTIVDNYMAGANGNFTNFTVTVSGTHNGTAYTGNGVNNLVAGDLITVTVSGEYNFMNVIPFHKWSSSLTITSSVTMVCEGAM
jgi:Flp pilus assembly protein TadG